MLPQTAGCSAARVRPGGETAHHYFGGPDPDQPARGNHPILTLGNPGPVNGSSHLWPTRGHFQATPEPGRADQAGNSCTFMALHQQILRSARHDMTRFQGNDPLGQIRMICARAAVRQVYPLGANIRSVAAEGSARPLCSLGVASVFHALSAVRQTTRPARSVARSVRRHALGRAWRRGGAPQDAPSCAAARRTRALTTSWPRPALTGAPYCAMAQSVRRHAS